MSQTQITETARNGVPDREVIQADLEATRAAFHDLMAAVPPEAWQRQGATTAWTVRELATHMVIDLEFVPKMVAHARAGKNMLNFPSFIGDKINYLVTRFKARKATPQSLCQEYDAYFEKALTVLTEVQDDEWQCGAEFFGEGYWTVASIFSNLPRHFEEHAAQIREVCQ
jgi:hypothetical protein